MNFCSDNVTGASPEILSALIAANGGAAMPYGADDITQRLQQRFCDLFETNLSMFPVATGSAANALALSVVAPPYGAIYCHAEAHINVDECGAPELFTGGAKLVTLPGENGKITAEALAHALAHAGIGFVHHVQPAAVSITQATEAGTVYTLEEIRAIAQVAHQYHLPLHLDGARFANALVSLGCTPAEMTWQAGVDMLSFGATKNGAIAAEAVLFFNPEQAAGFEYRRKRGGHLFSKMRFLSAQLEAYLTDDLWLRNAAHANCLAQRLAAGLRKIPGVTLAYPVEANELFVRFPDPILKGLQADGFQFYAWESDGRSMVRLVTAFNTAEADVDAFLSAAQRHSRPIVDEAVDEAIAS
ncbi:low specificity L-threonine aldolase [Thermoleptolyngbya sichuanensis A183]|uniref:L-threonine aldolase n=1 Tax=Thermoleptolyngbya sichuanensis A183 TaxID=2737172 RepID=A0A6M8B3Z1_9CYAN|nr:MULTISPECIES: low specificity L-threonine aldolase [Thermoleptolyngbya]QKD81899.1 low specificity L-threonine aldolase [Thermoleptolyngbya sichuanensis A183]